MFRRIWSLVIKEFIHLRTDWWLPAFMLLGGGMELLLVGWVTSRPITNLPFMVMDQDRSSDSRRIVAALENTGTFSAAQYVEEMQTIQDAMDRGKINAAVVFPQGFSTGLAASGGSPVIFVILNGAESNPATVALRAIEGVVNELDQRIVLRRLGLQADDLAGYDPSLRVWFNETLSEALYTTPAELGLMVEFTVLLFAALAFSRERELGTLEQLLVMPYTSMEIIIGKSIPVLLVGFLDFLLMLSMVHFAFGVPLRGSLALLLLLAFGYLLVELSKGMIISVIARTQHQAFLLVMLVGMADFMFTGYAAPVEGMPQVLQWFANLVPAHHWLTILRSILLKGVGLEILWTHVAALAALGLLIGTFSLRFVRKALD